MLYTLDVYLPFNHLWSFRPLVAPPHCARWPPWSLQLMESLSVNGASQQVTGILPLFFCEPKKRIPYHARHFFRKKTHRKMPTPKPKKKRNMPTFDIWHQSRSFTTSWWFQPPSKNSKNGFIFPEVLGKNKRYLKPPPSYIILLNS